MADTKTMVKFKFGEYSGFKGLAVSEGGKGYEAGTLYVTTDEQGLYFAKDNVNKPIKLGNIITYESVTAFNENTQPPYSADVFYYITEGNMLFKYNVGEGKFVQLNKDYGTDVKGIKDVIGTKADADTVDTLWGQINKAQKEAGEAQTIANNGLEKATANAGEITTIKGNITTIGGQITGLDGRLTTAEGVAADNKAAIEDANTGLNALSGKIGENATAISNLTTDITNNVKPLAQQGVNDAATAKGIADEAKATANANKLAIENSTTGLNALKGRIDDLDNEVADLKSEDSRLAEEIGKVDDKVTANAAEFAKYYTKEEIDAELDAITGGTGTGTLADLKDYIDDEVERVEGVIAGVDSKVDDLESRIDNVTNVMNFRGVFDATSDVTEPKVGDVIVVGTLEYVYVEKETDDGVKGSWEPFGTVSDTETRFQGIESRLDTAEGKIETAEGEIDTLQTDVGDLKTAVGGHTTKLGVIETDIEGLKSNVGAATDTAAVDGSLHARLKAEIARAEGAESALDGKITALDAAYKAADANLQTAINDLDTAYKAADTTINGEITNIKGRLDTAEGKVSTLETDLAAEIKRAGDAEKAIEEAYKAEDAEIKSYINDALAWGTF